MTDLSDLSRDVKASVTSKFYFRRIDVVLPLLLSANYTLGLGWAFELSVLIIFVLIQIVLMRRYIRNVTCTALLGLSFLYLIIWYFLVSSNNVDGLNYATVLLFKMIRMLAILYISYQLSKIFRFSALLYQYTVVLALFSIVAWMVLTIASKHAIFGVEIIQTDGRLQMFGNPNYIAFWVALVLLLGISLYEAKIINRKNLVASSMILFVFVVATLSRSIFISLVFVIMITNLVGAFKLDNHHIVVKMSTAILLCGCFFAATSFLFFAQNNDLGLFNRLLSFPEFYASCSEDCGRNAIWKYLLERFAEAPLTIKMFGLSLHGAIISDHDFVIFPHNNYIFVLLNFGIVGIILLFSIIFGGLIYSIRRGSMHMARFLIFASILSMGMDFYHGLSFAVMLGVFLNPQWRVLGRHES